MNACRRSSKWLAFTFTALSSSTILQAQTVVDIVQAFQTPAPIGPRAALIRATDDNFYGVTDHGGLDDCGTIFRMTPIDTVTVLHSFDCVDGAVPSLSLLQASDGYLYGLARRTRDLGTIIFRSSLDGDFAVLGVVHESDGPGVALVQGPPGWLYGATVTQPFRFNRTSGALEFLTERSPAVVAMTADSNGVVYAGIKYRCVVLEVYLGSCYVLDAFVGSSVIELHQFKPPDGCGEFGCQGNEIVTALLATPGALYGAGGPTQFFRYDASGFHALPPVGAVRRNVSGLTLATDGRIYGVNSDGGSDGNGCAFRLDADGTVTILQCFAGGSDVGAIEGGLVETADGTFLGLMVVSDPPTGGLAYGLTPSGEFSVRHHFEGNAEGSLPTHLIQSTDGALYGTTMMGGGLLNSGTIYRLADRGSVDVLHAVPSFRLETTVDATPTLMQATDGMLYATYIDTSFGGVFRVTTSGAYEHGAQFLGKRRG